MNMTTIHTPGPWRLGDVRWPNAVYGRAETTIQAADGTNIATLRAGGPIFEANARLLAAAPEMRELLIALSAMPHRDPFAVEKARALLARLDGDAR